MKKTLFTLIALACLACGSNETTAEVKKEDSAAADQTKTDQPKYTRDDLKKIKWIEGEWEGLYKGNPFYEMYRFTNDSTLEIRTYDWNGKDSSNTNMSYVYFKDGSYYLGEKQNYKVVSITESEIKMVPNFEANNDITWKYRDNTGWDAILTAKSGTVVYNMKHNNPFKK